MKIFEHKQDSFLQDIKNKKKIEELIRDLTQLSKMTSIKQKNSKI